QQPNGKDWTVSAFFQNASHGLGLAVDGGETTRTSLVGAAPQLLGRTVESLRTVSGGIDAEFLTSVLIADPVRHLLEWIDRPEATHAALDDASWDAFARQVKGRYNLDLVRDGVLEAARMLGEAKAGSNWDLVWQRYAEAPAAYPAIPDRLRSARPANRPAKTLFEPEVSYHWPQENEDGERELRGDLLALEDLPDQEARARIIALNAQHAARRESIWAAMGQSPLAFALEHLAFIAEKTSAPFPAGSVNAMQDAYTDWGWEIDARALGCTSDLPPGADRSPVDVALDRIYTPWLWTTATHFQEAMLAHALPRHPTPLEVEPGTCVLFADGLRYDLGMELAAALRTDGGTVDLRADLGPLPGVTASAKPAQSPVAHRLHAGPEFAAVFSGRSLPIESFRRLIQEEGWQVLQGDDVGAPANDARAWTEFGKIDTQGHADPGGLPQQAVQEVARIRQRIGGLLAAGWARVRVVTDHGWLLTPNPMPKTELPAAVSGEKKGRCARLADGATVTVQTVPWIWDEAVRMAVPPGISSFEAGKRYAHGGLSLQECILPTITVLGSGPGAATPHVAAGFTRVEWNGMRCNVDVEGAPAGAMLDVRRKANDPATSLAHRRSTVREDGTGTVFVADDAHQHTAALVVVLDAGGAVIAQRHTVVGGEE
ncbi:MAG: BREX-1 system phosphatase PglZ type B, partial [Thermomicrobiales bacterium]